MPFGIFFGGTLFLFRWESWKPFVVFGTPLGSMLKPDWHARWSKLCNAKLLNSKKTNDEKQKNPYFSCIEKISFLAAHQAPNLSQGTLDIQSSSRPSGSGSSSKSSGSSRPFWWNFGKVLVNSWKGNKWNWQISFIFKACCNFHNEFFINFKFLITKTKIAYD